MFELESREKGRAGDEYCTKKKNEIPKYGECKIQILRNEDYLIHRRLTSQMNHKYTNDKRKALRKHQCLNNKTNK